MTILLFNAELTNVFYNYNCTQIDDVYVELLQAWKFPPFLGQCHLSSWVFQICRSLYGAWTTSTQDEVLLRLERDDEYQFTCLHHPDLIGFITSIFRIPVLERDATKMILRSISSIWTSQIQMPESSQHLQIGHLSICEHQRGIPPFNILLDLIL